MVCCSSARLRSVMSVSVTIEPTLALLSSTSGPALSRKADLAWPFAAQLHFDAVKRLRRQHGVEAFGGKSRQRSRLVRALRFERKRFGKHAANRRLLGELLGRARWRG